MEIKCPYCYTWNYISRYDYEMNDYEICAECYHQFIIDDTISEH